MTLQVTSGEMRLVELVEQFPKSKSKLGTCVRKISVFPALLVALILILVNPDFFLLVRTLVKSSDQLATFNIVATCCSPRFWIDIT